MSIDKTLKLTDESGSDITSILDSKLRATVTSYQEQFQGSTRLTNSHSLKNLRTQSNQVDQLQYQNQLLRAQIISLKKQLKFERQNKSHQVLQLQNEVQKLKKLIQKSYYSLKSLEKQNIAFQSEITNVRQTQKKSNQRVTYLQNKTLEMFNYIKQLKQNHEKQAKLIWERVAHLQKNLEAVVALIDQDKKQERYYRTRLQNSRVQHSSSSMKSIRFH